MTEIQLCMTIPLTAGIVEPNLLFLIQLLLIIIASKCCGFVLSRLGQPAVIGEIAAGIILGPSVFGALLPDLSAFLFPAASISGLQSISQIGLVLFMFIVGLELNLVELRGELRTVIGISTASILLPFILGAILALQLYQQFRPEQYEATPFALFMGIAFAITAFPVLARIILERKLQRTRVGYISLSSAAINDCAAWFLLSAVLAYIKTDNLYDAGIRFLYITGYLLFMGYVVRWLLHRAYERLTRYFPLIIMITMLMSAIATEFLGIHALFGAFLAGLIISDLHFDKSEMILKLHDVSVNLFLPVFFAISGLRTSIGLINSGGLWTVFFVVLLVASLGKFLSGTLASRVAGLQWREAFSVGILMNTRGLIELIILNIGYDLGLIGPTLFAIMVLMALTTTFMTGPLLDLVYTSRRQGARKADGD